MSIKIGCDPGDDASIRKVHRYLGSQRHRGGTCLIKQRLSAQQSFLGVSPNTYKLTIATGKNGQHTVQNHMIINGFTALDKSARGGRYRHLVFTHIQVLPNPHDNAQALFLPRRLSRFAQEQGENTACLTTLNDQIIGPF